MIKTSDAATGKWRGILSQFGISDSVLSGKHQPCPGCGGKDRFRFADIAGQGNYFCSGCGHGDGFQLIEICTGIGFKEASAKIDSIVGNIKAGKILTTDYEKNAARLQRISSELQPIDNNIRQYLSSRNLKPCKNLRMHPGMDYYEDGKLIGKYPAMVARVSAQDGSLVTYHMTFILSGEKAPVKQVKKLMPIAQPMSGGCIRLTDTYETIGITEGIETALACMSHFKVPVWAAGNSGLLRAFQVPSGVSKVLVLSDNDKNFTGQAASYHLANRLAIRGGVEVEVAIPSKPGDFLDEINSEA